MSRARFAGSIVTLSLLLSAAPIAQERRQAGGGGPRPYDLAAETTIRATAGRTFTIPAGPQQEMVVLTVTTEGGALQLILAPPDVVKKQAFSVKEGAAVEVTGIPGFQVNGEPAMMTRQVKSGSQTLTVRDATGKQVW